MYSEHSEGDVKFFAPTARIVSRKLPVFYNPVMKMNRDISILLLKAIACDNLRIALPLAGTGIRGLRLKKELPKTVMELYMNDHSAEAVRLIKKNLKLNQVNAIVTNQDSDRFFINSTGFDYIDIDPFGSPNHFIDAACKRISRDGIVAITATDTAPLCGTYPKACKRKYWSTPRRDYMMHETGIRILIRKIQLIGAQYDRALEPVFSYYLDHYFRVYFRAGKGKKKADEIISYHDNFNSAGPMWVGRLWNPGIVAQMQKANSIPELESFLQIIADESAVGTVGHHDIHSSGKKLKLKTLPPTKDVLRVLHEKGYKASNTHFLNTSIRTDAQEKIIEESIQQLV